MVLTDDLGNDVIFEFNLEQHAVDGRRLDRGSLTTRSARSTWSPTTWSAAINAANIGITAQNQGVGRVSLGRIDQARVNINGIADRPIRR